jgi:hypothetical protein
MLFSHSTCDACARRAATMLSAVLLLIVNAASGDAQNLTITGGTLDSDLRVTQAAHITLEGDRGFTFTGNSFVGHFRPWDDCHLVGAAPCGPGDRLSLYASWSSSDLPGVATLDGVTYSKVGGPADPGLTVEFSGSVLLPPLSASATVVAPLAFDGRFSVPGGPIILAGSGMATLNLEPDRAFPGRWRVNEVHYRLGPALPSPWVAADVGSVALSGRSTALDETLVVLGDGSDVWGVADAFRFGPPTRFRRRRILRPHRSRGEDVSGTVLPAYDSARVCQGRDHAA